MALLATRGLGRGGHGALVADGLTRGVADVETPEESIWTVGPVEAPTVGELERLWALELEGPVFELVSAGFVFGELESNWVLGDLTRIDPGDLEVSAAGEFGGIAAGLLESTTIDGMDSHTAGDLNLSEPGELQ